MSATNPFVSQESAVMGQLYLHASPSYNPQLWTISGLLGLSFLTAIISLVLRQRRGTFWLYRLHPTAFGSWIAPNAIVCWLIWSSVFSALAQLFVYYAYHTGLEGSDLSNQMIWRCIIWLPLWIGGLSMTWSTALSPILSRPVSPDHSSAFDISRYPHVVSTFFLALHAIAFASAIPIPIITNYRFQAVYGTGKRLLGVLAVARAAFDEGGVATQAVEIQSLSVLMERQFLDMVVWWRTTWIVYTVLNGVLVFVFVIAALTHYVSLKKAMWGVEGASSEGRGSSSRQMKALVWSYRVLLFTTFVTLAIAVLLFAVNILVTIKAEEVARATFLSEICALLSIWIPTVFGTLTNVVILARSIFFNTPVVASASIPLSYRNGTKSGHAWGSKRPGSGSLAANVTITQEIVTSEQYEVGFSPTTPRGGAEGKEWWDREGGEVKYTHAF